MSRFGRIRLGAEIEAPIRCTEPSKDAQVRLAVAAKRIIPLLKQVGIECSTDAYIGVNPKPPDYTNWRAVADVTTYHPNFPHDGVAPLEFNSPVWEADEGKWVTDLEVFEEVLCAELAKDVPESFQLCSTQLHVSFTGQQDKKGGVAKDVPAEAAQLIAFPAYLFRGVIDGLMPLKSPLLQRHTRPNTMLKDIENPPDGDEESLQEIWKKMRGIETLQNLHRMVCWERDYDAGRLARKKYYKWNFMGANNMALHWKTIEYRQLPPVTSKGQLVTMVNFLLGFVSAAIAIDPEKLDEAAKSADESAICTVYGIDKKPAGFADIRKFIMEYSTYKVNEALLDQVPKLREQLETAWGS